MGTGGMQFIPCAFVLWKWNTLWNITGNSLGGKHTRTLREKYSAGHLKQKYQFRFGLVLLFFPGVSCIYICVMSDQRPKSISEDEREGGRGDPAHKQLSSSGEHPGAERLRGYMVSSPSWNAWSPRGEEGHACVKFRPKASFWMEAIRACAIIQPARTPVVCMGSYFS